MAFSFKIAHSTMVIWMIWLGKVGNPDSGRFFLGIKNPLPAKPEAGSNPINRIGADTSICHQTVARASYVDQIGWGMDIGFNGLA